MTRISREAGAMVWCNTKLRDKDVAVHNTASGEKFGFLGLAKEVVPHDRHLVAELLRRKIFGMTGSSHSCQSSQQKRRVISRHHRFQKFRVHTFVCPADVSPAQ